METLALLGSSDDARPAADRRGVPQALMRVIQQSFEIRRHGELLEWLQGPCQRLIPHGILLAAWGNTGLTEFRVDVTSTVQDVRTAALDEAHLKPLVADLLAHWQAAGGRPCELAADEGFTVSACPAGSHRQAGFGGMRRALVHGIHNQRDGQLCLYALLHTRPFPAPCAGNLEVLLPYIDAALRQVEHLPAQCGAEPEPPPASALGLSEREADILRWVGAGKTNQEIGLIMDISPFTVKNHLKRIFQKLDVSNRAQAVDKLSNRGAKPARRASTR